MGIPRDVANAITAAAAVVGAGQVVSSVVSVKAGTLTPPPIDQIHYDPLAGDDGDRSIHITITPYSGLSTLRQVFEIGFMNATEISFNPPFTFLTAGMTSQLFNSSAFSTGSSYLNAPDGKIYLPRRGKWKVIFNAFGLQVAKTGQPLSTQSTLSFVVNGVTQESLGFSWETFHFTSIDPFAVEQTTDGKVWISSVSAMAETTINIGSYGESLDILDSTPDLFAVTGNGDPFGHRACIFSGVLIWEG